MQAAVTYAKRYAELAKDMARKESSAARKAELEVIARYHCKTVVNHFNKSTVENISLVVYTHREGYLIYHFFNYRLLDYKASVTCKVGDHRKILTREGYHLMRRFSTSDTS